MSPDRLSLVFSALADPTRRAILSRLSSGARSVTELAAPHDMSLPAISKHLRVLERSGLIERGREAQWRPCRIKAAPMKEAVDWLETYRRHWEERLDRLDEYLQKLQKKEPTIKIEKPWPQEKISLPGKNLPTGSSSRVSLLRPGRSFLRSGRSRNISSNGARRMASRFLYRKGS